MSTTTADIEALRAEIHVQVDLAFNRLVDRVPKTTSTFKMPTLADGHDPRNKNGQNLTPRGIEILYRVFDDNGGYNRAAKMLNISQGAAKNRKGSWLKAGGTNRVKSVLDIDAP
jgi:hypothetical protein